LRGSRNAAKLVRLDLSFINPYFCILNLGRAVSKLYCLKEFHFPGRSLNHTDVEVNANGQSEETPKWPGSLEKFYIPCSLDDSYIPAFENAPASLTSLKIENDDGRASVGVLDAVFELIGP
jgi:hypothetical protein